MPIRSKIVKAEVLGWWSRDHWHCTPAILLQVVALLRQLLSLQHRYFYQNSSICTTSTPESIPHRIPRCARQSRGLALLWRRSRCIDAPSFICFIPPSFLPRPVVTPSPHLLPPTLLHDTAPIWSPLLYFRVPASHWGVSSTLLRSSSVPRSWLQHPLVTQIYRH
jgi:hypothetical protein